MKPEQHWQLDESPHAMLGDGDVLAEPQPRWYTPPVQFACTRGADTHFITVGVIETANMRRFFMRTRTFVCCQLRVCAGQSWLPCRRASLQASVLM